MLKHGKGKLKMIGKFCGIFICPCPIFFPCTMKIHFLSVVNWSLFSEEEQILFLKDYVYSNLSGGYLEGWYKTFVLLNLELTQGTNMLGIIVSQKNNLQLPGAKEPQLRQAKKYWKPGRKSWRGCLESQVIQRCLCVLWSAWQGRIYAWERPEKTLNFYFWLN